MIRILVVENDPSWKKFVIRTLGGAYTLNFPPPDADVKRELQASHYDVVIVDQDLLQRDPVEILAWIRAGNPFLPVIMTSPTEKVEQVVTALKKGAFDFLVRPLAPVKLRHVVRQALENRSLKNEIAYLRHEQDVIYRFEGLVSESRPMKDLIRTMEKFARTDATILMTGETGTGKSFFSGSIHFNSPRKSKPFIKINCANLPENLLESELFGHEKGAFTGAEKLRVGRFEQADGGTLFLDEIGEISFPLQAKLLRILEDKSFERLGGNRTLQSDVRVIAATNKNLEDEVAAGRFREDLFYRINILSVVVPPLRSRKEDLPQLAGQLLNKISRSLKKKVIRFSPEAMEAMIRYDWPGNVRQLSNVIERAVILADGQVIRKEDLPVLESRKPASQPLPGPLDHSVPEDGERARVIYALEQNLWVQKDAARQLGISPRVLNYKIQKMGITHPRWRKNKATV